MKLSAFDVLFLIACGIHVESCDFAEREPVWELDGDAETINTLNDEITKTSQAIHDAISEAPVGECSACFDLRSQPSRLALLAFGADGKLVCRCGRVFLKDSGAIPGSVA